MRSAQISSLKESMRISTEALLNSAGEAAVTAWLCIGTDNFSTLEGLVVGDHRSSNIPVYFSRSLQILLSRQKQLCLTQMQIQYA